MLGLRKEYFMKKKLLALFLILCMAMTMFVACGEKDSDDDDEDDGKKTEISNDDGGKADSVGDIMDQVQNITSATFDMGIKLSMPGQELTMSLFGATDSENASVGANVQADMEGNEINLAIDEIIVVADGVAYVNAGELLDFVMTFDAEAADALSIIEVDWFAVPLPDEYAKSTQTISEESQKIATELIKDLAAAGEQSGTKVTFSTAESVKNALEVMAVFLETDAEKFFAEVVDSTSEVPIDMNAYAEKLLDFYYDDLVELAEMMGMSKSDVDEAIEEVKGQDLNQYVEDAFEAEVEVPSSAELAQMAAQLREAKESLTDEMMEGISLTIEASKDGDTYRVDAMLSAEQEGEKVEMNAYYEIVSKSVNVSAPGNVTSLKDLLGNLLEAGMAY